MKLTFHSSMLLLLASPLTAGALLTLDPSPIAASPGNAVTISGSITNTGGEELFLNGISFTLGSAELAFDPTHFFNLVPASLGMGLSYAGPLFDVVVSSTIAAGDYGGSVGFLGGPEQVSASEVAFADFTVRVTSEVPEPNPLGLSIAILAAILLFQAKANSAIKASLANQHPYFNDLTNPKTAHERRRIGTPLNPAPSAPDPATNAAGSSRPTSKQSPAPSPDHHDPGPPQTEHSRRVCSNARTAATPPASSQHVATMRRS